MIEIPLGLKQAIESGNTVLFLGAGIGHYLYDQDGNPAPDSAVLTQDLANHFSIDTDGSHDLSKISQIVQLRHGRTELETFLKKKLANLQPDKTLQYLLSLRWRAVYTTNFDTGIERAYELNDNPIQRPVTISITPDIVPYDARFDIPIYHLHGILFSVTEPKIIITGTDYARFLNHRKQLFSILKTDFATSTILYVGYSNQDPNWNMTLSEISAEFSPSPLSKSFRIAPNTESLEIEILKSKNIDTIECDLNAFVNALKLQVRSIDDQSNIYSSLRDSLPTDLMDAFETNEVAIGRFLSSWTYVNQTTFDENENIRDFLRGDLPNWGLIASNGYFKRDIEEPILDECLDYVTSDRDSPGVSFLLGSAGYGISTVMMALAVTLVKEEAGPVFFHKPGHPLLEGDILFASSIFPECPFFFVDNAADHVSALQSMIRQFRDSKKTVMFVLGERINEWRQSRARIGGQEFEIESLSDIEINKLIDYLEKHSALNALEPLRPELRFAAIKKNYRQELLVTMMEATEGKSFNAILEDEYRGIGSAFSRQLYLLVCCFHQHSTFIRDSLIAELLNTTLAELYENTKDSTEGVVIYECLDSYKGLYAARSRHRSIARVVWERCGDSIEKERLIHSALSSLNLNYTSDKVAFEHFIRSDRLVDSIQSLEGRIKFFDLSCQKDPESPYIRQHYARMLLRNGSSELALSQIDVALSLNSGIKILHHTRGLILLDLARNISSSEIARRRLTQSEASFRRGLTMGRKDEFFYQGLARLYFEWAKRAPSPEESAEYLSKAEEIISDGLARAYSKSSLWIESSNIQAFIGDKPSSLLALEKAIQVSPGSIVARYLLGRTYRKENRFEDAVTVLEPTIINHFDAFRSFVEYAISLAHITRNYEEPIAVLKLSTIYGYSDPRFIATLAGMLFMSEHFSEADEVFQESTKRNFLTPELNSIQFRPINFIDPSTPFRIPGKVIQVKAGYALIESDIYPTFLCLRSGFGKTIVKIGMDITFLPAFSAKGAIALSLKSIPENTN